MQICHGNVYSACILILTHAEWPLVAGAEL